MPGPLILSALGCLAAGSGGMFTSSATAQPTPMWEIGPTISGRNYSVGMPATPTPAERGWYFDFPYPSAAAGHVNYVTAPTGPLIGKSKIVMRYRIDAAPGVRIVARHNPQRTATLTPYFQRRDDNWSGRGPFEHYRWYTRDAYRIPLVPGEHQVAVPLDAGNWKSVMSDTGVTAPIQFRDALHNAGRVGFVLGGAGGAGHGVYSTGPARFTLISFEVL